MRIPIVNTSGEPLVRSVRKANPPLPPFSKGGNNRVATYFVLNASLIPPLGKGGKSRAATDLVLDASLIPPLEKGGEGGFDSQV